MRNSIFLHFNILICKNKHNNTCLLYLRFKNICVFWRKNIIKLLLFPLNKMRKFSFFLVEHGCPPIWAKHVIKGIFQDNFNRSKGQVPFVPLEVSLFLHSSTYNNHCFCRWSIYAFRKLSSQYIQFCQL